ncbi:DNA-binding MurR/RpiR family transcriptional regulator [Bradyrhizobium sp. GM7.3]
MARAKRNHPARAVGAAISKPPGDDNVVAGDIISLIRQSALSLSPSEQRVATVLLADMEFAVHASNSELARRARVSEPTVTRFSRSVGCRGVRDLKVRLAQAMAVGRIYVELPPHVGTDLARPALWRSVFQEIRRAIAAAEEGLRKEDIERAAEAISRCSKLAAFGVGGGSTLAAAEVQNRFFRLGIAVSHASDPSLMAHDCRDLRTG